MFFFLVCCKKILEFVGILMAVNDPYFLLNVKMIFRNLAVVSSDEFSVFLNDVINDFSTLKKFCLLFMFL